MLFSPKPAVALHLIQKIKSNFGGGGVKHEYEISINKNKIFNEFDIGEIIFHSPSSLIIHSKQKPHFKGSRYI